MPPYLLNTQKFADFFEYYDKEYYESIMCSENEILTVCGTSTERDASNAKSNFMEMHKPILQYLHMKISEIQHETKHLARGIG